MDPPDDDDSDGILAASPQDKGSNHSVKGRGRGTGRGAGRSRGRGKGAQIVHDSASDVISPSTENAAAAVAVADKSPVAAVVDKSPVTPVQKPAKKSRVSTAKVPEETGPTATEPTKNGPKVTVPTETGPSTAEVPKKRKKAKSAADTETAISESTMAGMAVADPPLEAAEPVTSRKGKKKKIAKEQPCADEAFLICLFMAFKFFMAVSCLFPGHGGSWGGPARSIPSPSSPSTPPPHKTYGKHC